MDLKFFDGKAAHAMIFESSELEKALTEAKNVAARLLCLSQDGEKPCGECPACLKVKKHAHPDLKIVSPAGDSKTIKIDQVRFVRQDAWVIANEGKFKIYIFSPAESLTPQAQNAFIKILEEPPENVVFLLACTSSELLLPTVLSRCEIFRLKSSNPENLGGEIKEKAKEILNLSFKGEKVKILEVLAAFPSDREAFKNLISLLMQGLIEKVKEHPDFALQATEKIDKLKILMEFLEKNVNLNLVVSCLSAEL